MTASYFAGPPKQASAYDPTAGGYFLPSATRPLSLVNTDSWLIASALQIAVEPINDKVVSTLQMGFVRGRQMLSNVMDIDFGSMQIFLVGTHGAILLFDF